MKRPLSYLFTLFALAELELPVLAQAPASSAAEGQAAAIVQPEVLVTADAVTYLPSVVQSGSKLDIPAKDQVQTVNTLTTQEMTDRGIISLNQAVEVIPGVRPVSGVYSSTDVTSGIRSRGFENRFSFINGMRFQAFGFPIETQMTDTLEVLKGPAGVSFGQGDPGGTLNIVTKRPVADPFTELGFTLGSHDLYRSTLDWNGTLLSEPAPSSSPSSGKSGKSVQPAAAGERAVLQGRLNAAYQNSGSYRDFVDSERFLIAPSVTWNISEDTTLNIQFSYMRDDFLFDRGLPPYPITLTLPRSRFTGDPDQPRSLIETYMGFWELEHRLNDSWKVVQRAGYATQNGSTFELSSFSPLNGQGSDGQFPRDAYPGGVDNTYWLIQHQLHGQFETGSLKHKMVLGFEYSYTEFGYVFDLLQQVQPFNLRRPVYGGFNFNGPKVAGYHYDEAYGDKAWAAYWDHQIELTPELKLALGSRLDWSDGYYDSPYDNATGDRKQFGWSPRAGLVWQPKESLDLFGSYAQTFAPNVFADGTGTVFDPEEGEAAEIGFRQRFFDQKLQLSAAAFHITKQNILNPDPTDPQGLRQVLNGEERSKGIELELKGTLSPGWTMAAGYTYLDAEVTESTTDPIGLPLIDAPEHQASFFTRYQIQDGWAKGFFIGYGMIYADERRSSFANPTFNLPEHVRHDAFVGYEKDAWRAQVTLENLASTDYYETHGNNIFPQDGFNVRASLTYKF